VKAFKQQGVAKEGILQAYEKGKAINIRIEQNYVPFNCLHLLSLHATSVGIVAVSAWLALEGAISLPAMVMMFIFSFMIFNQVEMLNSASHVLEVIDITLDKLQEMEESAQLNRHGSQTIRLARRRQNHPDDRAPLGDHPKCRSNPRSRQRQNRATRNA
jgi:ATP-binding cassette subfamily B protein IrtB